MAVIGDPQLGFSDYKADVIRFRQAVEQVNQFGAEVTLVMGDLVHDNDNEQAYRDVKEFGRRRKSPVYGRAADVTAVEKRIIVVIPTTLASEFCKTVQPQYAEEPKECVGVRQLSSSQREPMLLAS